MALIFPTFTSVFPWWPFVFRAWLLCCEREGHHCRRNSSSNRRENARRARRVVSSGSHHLINQMYQNVPNAGHSWRISMLLTAFNVLIKAPRIHITKFLWVSSLLAVIVIAQYNYSVNVTIFLFSSDCNIVSVLISFFFCHSLLTQIRRFFAAIMRCWGEASASHLRS